MTDPTDTGRTPDSPAAAPGDAPADGDTSADGGARAGGGGTPPPPTDTPPPTATPAGRGSSTGQPPSPKKAAGRKKKPGRRPRSRTDLSMKTVFTTGEAAKICKVSQQTIIRCFDSGQLGGFRVPGSRFRRIPREVLFKFMKENGIPTDALESGKRKALIVDDDESLVDLIRDVLDADGRFDVRAVNNGFDAGITVKEYKPDVMILDIMLPDINGKEVCERVRGDSNLDATKIICISGMVEREKVNDLIDAGADDFLHKPFDVEVLLNRVCKLMEMEAPGR